MRGGRRRLCRPALLLRLHRSGPRGFGRSPEPRPRLEQRIQVWPTLFSTARVALGVQVRS